MTSNAQTCGMIHCRWRSLLTPESAAVPEEIPIVLGFESGNTFNAEQRRIIGEAYRRGRERAENLGALIRKIIASAPPDGG